MNQSERKTGTIKDLLVGKGYGFIESEGEKIYFHFRDVSTATTYDNGRHFSVGAKVSFTLASADGKTRALSVHVLGGGK